MKTTPARPSRVKVSMAGQGATARPGVKAGPDPQVEDIRDAVSRLKRERIIATAADLFHQQGLNNTTLEAVAERMNVTKPFIYSHFRSKNDLLTEICSRAIRASLEVLNRVVASDGTVTDKLRTLSHDFMMKVLENQAYIAIYTREEKHLSPESGVAINTLRREFDHKFTDLLAQGVANGEFIVEDVQLTSLAIGGIISWSYVWYRPGGRLTPEQTAQRITDLVLSMVRADPTRRQGVAA